LPKTGCADIVHCSISYSLFIIHHSLFITQIFFISSKMEV